MKPIRRFKSVQEATDVFYTAPYGSEDSTDAFIYLWETSPEFRASAEENVKEFLEANEPKFCDSEGSPIHAAEDIALWMDISVDEIKRFSDKLNERSGKESNAKTNIKFEDSDDIHRIQ